MPYVLLSSFVSGALIAANWFIFIKAIAAKQVLESSLGYFLSPLFMVSLGAIVYKDKFSKIQGLAIGIATIGVGYQIIAFGRVPYYALGLAATFALYGIVRKRTSNLSSLQGLTLETILMSPFALCYLWELQVSGALAFGTTGVRDIILLIGIGGVTAVPLLLFAAGSQLIPYSTSGILQYITPTGHFILGIFVYKEQLSPSKAVAFGFIWLAVALYMFAILQKKEKKRQ